MRLLASPSLHVSQNDTVQSMEPLCVRLLRDDPKLPQERKCRRSTRTRLPNRRKPEETPFRNAKGHAKEEEGEPKTVRNFAKGNLRRSTKNRQVKKKVRPPISRDLEDVSAKMYRKRRTRTTHRVETKQGALQGRRSLQRLAEYKALASKAKTSHISQRQGCTLSTVVPHHMCRTFHLSCSKRRPSEKHRELLGN